jgi:UDPglucose--hexose-1-phosphate uridylyltransferase
LQPTFKPRNFSTIAPIYKSGSNLNLNSNFENEPYMEHLHKNYRFTIRITPRIYRLGGFEISTGMAINPVSPEECASLLNSKEI